MTVPTLMNHPSVVVSSVSIPFSWLSLTLFARASWSLDWPTHQRWDVDVERVGPELQNEYLSVR